jgi:hypothetical protein
MGGSQVKVWALSLALLISANLMCQPTFRTRFENAKTGIDRTAVFREWVRVDAPGAAIFVRDWNGGAERLPLLYTAVENWARKDPRAAARLVQDVRPADTAAALIIPLLLEWSRTDALAAVDWAAILPECSGKSPVSVLSMAGHTTLEGTRWCRADALAVIGFGWARVDAKAAMQWAEALKPEIVRTTVVEFVRQSRRLL